jgi:hypothetical protein
MRLPDGQFWTPEPWFCGETVFVLGGGPSIDDVDLARLRDRKVIVINSTAIAARDAGLDDAVLFWMDNSWWRKHQELCLSWRGSLVTKARIAKGDAPDLIRLVDTVTQPGAPKNTIFPPPGSPKIAWGRTSGHTAISLAIAMGAARVVLLGFDMRLADDGRSHHHDDYQRVTHAAVFADFLRHFEGWNRAALDTGVTVLNATPGSALDEFERVDLADELAGVRVVTTYAVGDPTPIRFRNRLVLRQQHA